MTLCGERGCAALFVGCVYMPTGSSELKEADGLSFREKRKVVFLGDLIARVGKAVDGDDVIGMFSEDT